VKKEEVYIISRRGIRWKNNERKIRKTKLLLIMLLFWVLSPCKFVGRQPTFRRNIVSIFRAADRDYMASKPRITTSPVLPMREPQISQSYFSIFNVFSTLVCFRKESLHRIGFLIS
jgi:hypothetical protein